jgi:UDP-N-acetylmuramyl pentapeptide phosphotransferase/UDP-N-acetylglucosamine-1-phosphate transferase
MNIYAIFFGFLFSCIISFLIIKNKKIFPYLFQDSTDGPQKIHQGNVPRIGGLAIFIAFCFALTFLVYSDMRFNHVSAKLFFTIFFIFVIGLIEDITKNIQPIKRLSLLSLSSAFLILSTDLQITSIENFLFDFLLSNYQFSVFFTVFCIVGLTNSYNIIDGLNGLATVIGIATLIAISYVSVMVNDLETAQLIITFAACLGGFFIWNYPRGEIFLGDSGAYLIGCFVALSCITLISKNTSLVSPWFAISVNIYPIYETIFSIIRRFNDEKLEITQADNQHLHTLIYKKLMSKNKSENNKEHVINSKSSPFLWALSFVGILPSFFWFNDTVKLQITCVVFAILYTFIYLKLKNNPK